MATGTDFWAGSDMCKHESICVSMNMNKKILPALLLAVCCWAGASAQQVAVKTNLLYWAAATPNVGAEVAVGKHSTLGFSANYNPWTIGSDNKIQHWFIRPEYRYWVTEKYTRLFFGVHAIGGKFEVGGFKLPFIGDKVFKGLQTNYYKGSFVGRRHQHRLPVLRQPPLEPRTFGRRRTGPPELPCRAGQRPEAQLLRRLQAFPADPHRDRRNVRLPVQLQEINDASHEKILLPFRISRCGAFAPRPDRGRCRRDA